LGPIRPTALGAFRYANKFIDEKTKWKETLLLKSKEEKPSLYGFRTRTGGAARIPHSAMPRG